MSSTQPTRREFLQGSTRIAAAGLVTPYFFSSIAETIFAKNDRPRVGCIALGDRWRTVIGNEVMKFGDVVAVCDVDRKHLEAGQEQVRRTQDQQPDAYEDYRKLLDRRDIEIVTIVTPDHWHAKCAIDAMRAGKDVYCEKPLSLTIDEGKKICKVARETGRVFQVGTTQRSEVRNELIKAVAMVRDGRIGKVQKIRCVINGSRRSEKLKVTPVPNELNWDLWLGQAPMTDYLGGGEKVGKYPQGRTHYEFRWWYEYSGGKMTDWGAHHVDIAHWAIGADNTGPLSVEGTAEFPVPLKNGMPTVSDQYNTAYKFAVTCKFADGVILEIHSEGRNGITFHGDKGKFFVTRGALTGKPVEELDNNPLPSQLITTLYKGKKPGNHMGNFFECVQDRTEPVSDVYSHHRSVSTCHLANIAIRLGRKIEWDPVKETIIGDDEANRFLVRDQRKGYEVVA
jgi:predicted dehydrogenase